MDVDSYDEKPFEHPLWPVTIASSDESPTPFHHHEPQAPQKQESPFPRLQRPRPKEFRTGRIEEWDVVGCRIFEMLIVRKIDDLTTETVQSPPLSLQSVDDIERGDGLPLGMLGVCDGISDDALEEGLED